MKKSIFILLVPLLFLSSCGEPLTSTTIPSNDGNPTSGTGSLPTTSEKEPTSSIDSSNNLQYSTLKDISSKALLGKVEKVRFKAKYLKKITDSNDKVMLFADHTDIMYVRVSNWTDYLNNRYLDYSYDVIGTTSVYNGNPEIIFESLTNLTTNVPVEIPTFTTNYNSIAELSEYLNTIKVNKKYNGFGKIVKFQAMVTAFDESDSRQKAVVSDGHNVITLVDDSKIAVDIGKVYEFTGATSINLSKPGILLLDSTLKSDAEPFVFEDINYKKASYFQSYDVTENTSFILPPSVDIYSKVYSTTGYIVDGELNSGKYYLGIINETTDSIKYKNGDTKPVNGLYLMNNTNLDERDLTYSEFYNDFVDGTEVTITFSLFGYEPNWHAWKIMPLKVTIA